MAIDRSFTRVLAAWAGILAIFIAGNFNVVRCHAAAQDVGDNPTLYAAVMDSNDTQTLSDQGSIIGWGDQHIDSSVFDAQFIAIAAGYSYGLAIRRQAPVTGP